MKLKSNILKLALFATGLSGIVAEYILSTLATYFLGNSVLQWTMIVSIMLFSMGLGSRISKFIDNNLLKKFILIEFTLSILTAFSSLLAYSAAAYTIYTGFIIYSLSILIGILIGMEIPLVIRINQQFEELKINVSSILEKDYYGSLAGGVFFAFIGLPLLGLTYTPFILGTINFAVAMILYLMLVPHLKPRLKWQLNSLSGGVAILLISGFFLAQPIILYGEQNRYKDKIIFEKQSKYQKIVMTQWKDDFWLYINGNQQLSTLDEQMYHEPLVHPSLSIHQLPRDILVLGGGDGCAVREILKYQEVNSITVVDLDPVMTELGRTHPIFTRLNNNALNHSKVHVINQDGYHFLEQDRQYYDVVIVDLPDPKTVELGRLYSFEFYSLIHKKLRPNGILVTQAGSPYYATKAFLCIRKTMDAAGFQTVPYHNQILTLGEWGWVLGIKEPAGRNLKQRLQQLDFEGINTRWLNQEAMQMITSFGKDIYAFPVDSVKINKVHDPVLYKYYLDGNWDLY
ncbi:MAG: polyamine aminopropyltransferase [Candidatus Cyclobacteriaceae bacterium M3_2C_046]